MVNPKYIAFTICSNNYLGQALALKNSFLQHNPDFELYIILVDKLSDNIDYKLINSAKLIPVAEIENIYIEELISRYYIIELNTSVKPSVFKHLIKHNPQAEIIYYLDPDLYFYKSFYELNEKLKSKDALLTPHILSPIPRDGKMPDENIFLRFGVYNLGFLGLNVKSNITLEMLDWWEERTLKFGYDRPKKGYFVDQLWMAQAPLFYDNIEVLKTYNYNMAPWNLHERKIVSIEGNNISLNDGSDLVFYHFSKIAEDNHSISREYDRFSLNEFPLLKQLYSDYKKELKKNNYYEYKKIQIAYNVRSMEVVPAEQPSLPKKILKKLGTSLIRFGNKF